MGYYTLKTIEIQDYINLQKYGSTLVFHIVSLFAIFALNVCQNLAIEKKCMKWDALKKKYFPILSTNWANFLSAKANFFF